MVHIKRLALLTAISITLPACNSSSTLPPLETISGSWRVNSIQEKPVMTKSTAKLIFNRENKLTGTASCNNISTSYSSKNNAISIGAIATTRKMCLPALMDQETTLLQALSKVRRFQLNDGELSMFDQQGSLQLKATRTK